MAISHDSHACPLFNRLAVEAITPQRQQSTINTTKTMQIKRLAENEGEFSTDVVLQVGDKYFLRHENGGSRGSHQSGNRFPALLDEDEELTAEEAALKCAEFGADDAVIESIG